MRVIAGSRRSLNLVAPKGDNTRPTQDITKETLFNVLQNQIPGAQFLDLFSGSGSIAIEALSRGAENAVLVENNKEAIACIKQNLIHTKFCDEATLMECDVMGALEKLKGHATFDVVFMDPPYQKGYEPDVLLKLSQADYVDEYTWIVVEAAKTTDISFIDELGFEIIKTKEYRTNKHIFLRRK